MTTNFCNHHKTICEKYNWGVTLNKYANGVMVCLSKYSPAGEDFSFEVEKTDFIDNVKQYAADFDIDEHIEMWIDSRKSGFKGIPSTRELVKDAEDIDKMLQELAAALAKSDY